MGDAYKKAGVNIEAGYQAVKEIKAHVARATRPEVMSSLGGFAALFKLPIEQYRKPVLVSGTDGVGTKLKIAFELNQHHTIGIDLVAMCANDILVIGAEPLFFLDYLATSKIEPSKVGQIVAGIAEGCVQAGCALIGGETAEMPGFYQAGEYDLAGFCVGIVEQDQIIDGSTIEPGDVILGLPSSGLHSNGFSLVRKLLVGNDKFDLNAIFDQGKTLGEILLTPTRIYVNALKGLIKQLPPAGMAHITGGSFIENIPRILPGSCNAEIELGSWPVPAIFRLLAEEGQLTHSDLYNTFNMGIGMVLVVKDDLLEATLKHFEQLGEPVYQIGKVTAGKQQVIFKEANQ